MSRSEIFDNFIKIAKDQGLVSENSCHEHEETDFHETNPRMDSLSIEQISKLYNVKTDKPKDMEYKYNIIEDAHPEPLFISPSYDKLNGLIENDNERQNIMARIVMKPTNGHLTNHKYAKQNFILSLVRTANELDNNNNDELRKLADICLVQATNSSIKKESWVLPAAGAIAAAIGLLWLQQHRDFHSDGFNQDYEKVITEVDQLLTSSSNWGVGYTFTKEFIAVVTELKSDLEKIHTAVNKVIPIVENIEKPRTKSEQEQELSRIAIDPKTQEANQAVKEFSDIVKEYGPKIRQTVINFGNQSFKDRAIAEKGSLTKMVDWAEILHGGSGLVADDFDDVARSLRTLWKDIVALYKAVGGAKGIEEKAKEEIAANQRNTEIPELEEKSQEIPKSEQKGKSLEQLFSGIKPV